MGSVKVGLSAKGWVTQPAEGFGVKGWSGLRHEQQSLRLVSQAFIKMCSDLS